MDEMTQQMQADFLAITHSTSQQRRALYRLGYSRSFLKKYANNKLAADRLIKAGISTVSAIKSNSFLKN